jgi:hypothetical protein
MAGKRRCSDPTISKEVLKSGKHLKKLPKKLESAALAFPDLMQYLPVVVFFEDEARIWKNQQGNSQLAKGQYNTLCSQTDDQGIYLCLFGLISINWGLLFYD